MKGFAMFTPEGDQLVRRIANTAIQMLKDGDFTTAGAYDFAFCKLRLLANSDDFGEANDTAVRECVLTVIDKGEYV